MKDKFSSFGSLLLSWYFAHDKRSFPWRKSKDPYQILVAELMLQRTKASQVVPVFLSFIDRFPSISVLATATLSEIQTYFSKLGLFWRAKNVALLAEKLKDFDRKIPRNREELMSLPGVGEYVADAVRCFAFREEVVIIDSNVCRILRRVFGLKQKREARRDSIYRKTANRLLPNSMCREFNWAMIDHASIICVPRNPKCSICPLNCICDYYLKSGVARAEVEKR